MIDWIVSLPYTVCRYNAVYTIVDWFCKLVIFILCRTDINAEKTESLLFKHWICQFGVPQNLLVLMINDLLINPSNSLCHYFSVS